MTYAALIEDRTGSAQSGIKDTQSQRRRQSDRGNAEKAGRRWSDHVEIAFVGSGDMPVTDQNFVTAAFAAQVLGQFTDHASRCGKTTPQSELYQRNQELMAASERNNRLLA